jgi:hypothetical protein
VMAGAGDRRIGKRCPNGHFNRVDQRTCDKCGQRL